VEEPAPPEGAGGAPAPEKKDKGRNSAAAQQRRAVARRGALLAVAFIVGFVILGVIAIQVWEYSNSVAFCSNTCHDVHPEEPAAYQDSYHARVKCTECHMGRTGTIEGIFLKAGHFRHLPEVIFNRYERPVESVTLRPPNESCERCHWPPAFHGDTVLDVRHYLPDEQNSAKNTYLTLKTGGGDPNMGEGFGIHWHISNKVEYIATGEQKQDIRWVRMTLPDGKTVEYNDVTNPMTPEEIAAATPKPMDCVDCHNRAGHPFPPPERLVDDSLATGAISSNLPWAKKEVTGILSADYADQAAGLKAAETLTETYTADYPEAAATHGPELNQAEATTKDLMTRVVFEEPGITWKSFPDNIGHKTFPGCFRCHDGKHLASDGTAIRLHCNICHGIPVTVSAGDRPPELPATSVQEPASHLETNFMADHRFLANEKDCSSCHGEMTFGADDKNFCSNSACHGEAWPQVELNAAFPHPIPLEGKHAEVWCNQCHQGVAKPEYVCSNCHEPPANHYGNNCESCHSPIGWKESAAQSGAGSAPAIPHKIEEQEECLLCHGAGGTGGATPIPASHKNFTEAQCTGCHKPKQ
jgi:hypothetical protein